MTALGPGTRVKCIKRDGWISLQHGFLPPAFGSVWTVKEVTEGFYTGRMMIVIAEWRPENWCFDPNCFVPLSGNEDISTLTALLNADARVSALREALIVIGTIRKRCEAGAL